MHSCQRLMHRPFDFIFDRDMAHAWCVQWPGMVQRFYLTGKEVSLDIRNE